MRGTDVLISQFAEDIEKGLSAAQKYIPSKYFYDAKGDALFQRIMHLPEYYLTASEFEIFKYQSQEIIRRASFREPVQVIELGAGDGIKTKLLLKEMLELGIDFTYYPIDISKNVLWHLEKGLKYELGLELKIHPIAGDYFDALKSEQFTDKGKHKLILFLGSSIGNFDRDSSNKFLYDLAQLLQPKDLLMIGYDLKKNPKVIADAYNDSQGVTREFNLNLLTRINHELEGDFDVDAFYHYPLYDPEEGAAKSYLVSKKKQTVFIGTLSRFFYFEEGEIIFTEISRKYTETDIEKMASYAGLKIKDSFYDSKHYFTDTLMYKL